MEPLPLRHRLRAWWEGYDLAELKRILARRQADSFDANSNEAPAVTSAVPPQRRATPMPPEAREPAGWTPQMLAAGQIVWGEHSLSPRRDAQLKTLAANAGIGSRSRVMHLGAELGGTALLLERGLGCKVLAAETQPALIAQSAGRVVLVSPQDEPILAAADFILVDGVAERGEPLATILRNQSAGLAPGGALVLRSLVLTEERAAGSARFRDWAAAEPVRPRLRSTEELSRILQEARLTVTATSSLSDDYAADVEQCWGDALDRIRALHRDPTGRALIPTLLTECERWLKRIELIREGILGVRQISATRRDRNRR